jgi:hypothetical protein
MNNLRGPKDALGRDSSEMCLIFWNHGNNNRCSTLDTLYGFFAASSGHARPLSGQTVLDFFSSSDFWAEVPSLRPAQTSKLETSLPRPVNWAMIAREIPLSYRFATRSKEFVRQTRIRVAHDLRVR